MSSTNGRIIGSAQRYAAVQALNELLESLGEMPILKKYELLEIESKGMVGNWRCGLRPIAPKFLALFYEASGKCDQRFLLTEEQKSLLHQRNRSEIPSNAKWPSISEEDLAEILTRYESDVPEEFRQKSETRENRVSTGEHTARPNTTSKGREPPKKQIAAKQNQAAEQPTQKAPKDISVLHGLLVLLSSMDSTIKGHPEFSRLAAKCGYVMSNTTVHQEPQNTPHTEARTESHPSENSVDLTLAELIAGLSALDEQLVRVIRGTHGKVTAEEAKSSPDLLRMILRITGTQETLNMPVPVEWTDMLKQFHGEALQLTSKQTKRGKP